MCVLGRRGGGGGGTAQCPSRGAFELEFLFLQVEREPDITGEFTLHVVSCRFIATDCCIVVRQF